MATCKNCGAALVDKGTYWQCPACFSRFDKSSISTPVSGAPVLNCSASIYDKNIKGVFEIINTEDGSVGSGFLVKPNIVATNAHVVENEAKGRQAKKVYVKHQGKKYEASIIYYGVPSTANDIAILRLDENIPDTNVLTLGDSDSVKNGDEVCAIGNSLGEGLCITKGIVSDKNRLIHGETFIMSDVAINGGNSGGPLFNESGKVIAICVMSRVGANGMKYFIPINNLKEILHRF